MAVRLDRREQTTWYKLFNNFAWIHASQYTAQGAHPAYPVASGA
jgi:hypothetical protein